MAAADMAAWRRQNSDPVNVEIVLVDGNRLKGVILLSRDKNMREFLNIGSEAFIDFDCHRDGPVIVAKTSIRQLRSESANKQQEQIKIDALAARQAELDKVDPYRLLGVAPGADHETMRKAYFAKARLYHPDRFADQELPQEISDYLNAMARRLNAAYDELDETLKNQPKVEPASQPAAAPRTPRKFG